MNSVKTKSVAKTVNTKTVNKVVSKRKPQTEEQKQEKPLLAGLVS